MLFRQEHSLELLERPANGLGLTCERAAGTESRTAAGTKPFYAFPGARASRGAPPNGKRRGFAPAPRRARDGGPHEARPAARSAGPTPS